MRNQRGQITPMLYLGGAIALVGALYGLYATIDHRAYIRGQQEVQGRWDAANAAQRSKEEKQGE